MTSSVTRPVVGHSVNPFLFGTGSWVYGQLVGLARWRPVVVAKRRENAETFPFADVHALYDLPKLKQVAQRVSRRAKGFFPFHRRALADAGAQLLHSHFGSQGWKDLPLARDLGVPLVTSFYGADIWKLCRQESWRTRYAELFRDGALFLVEGNAMRNKVIELGCPPAKVVVQHLGVDLSDTACLTRKPDASGELRFLAAGRCVEKKGFELAVEAFARAHAKLDTLRLSLMLIAKSKGEQARVAALRAQVERLGLAGVVDFPPSMPYAEYRRALESYHVFLAPSLHAENGDAEGGAPVSLIEMSASGMPIVASDHCDIPEVVPHGVSGLIVPERDVDALAAAILQLGHAPDRWPDFGRAGRDHVESEYRLETQVPKLEQIYDGVVGA